ncbi:hypothetical protein Vadar_024367 [Vaccinium darrowii]|uniref:Uncharacterized protein n=1 Tax=Vaccinium darrowii TaxID=229202 RepID=A0ACB7YPE7_9ERIC|nr:hypothetical protein Vadar_024367 [Vaccinium darrowii]
MIVEARKVTIVRLQSHWNTGLAATRPGTKPRNHVRSVVACGHTSTREIPALESPDDLTEVIAADDRELIRRVRKREWAVVLRHPETIPKVWGHGPRLVVAQSSDLVSDTDLGCRDG